MEEIWLEILDDDLADYMKQNMGTRAPSSDAKFFPSGIVLPRRFLEVGRRILTLPVRDDDVWIISFPKCGTTWLQEMVWLLRSGCDFDKAKEVPLTSRSVFLEESGIAASLDTADSVADTMRMGSPRTIKTHLPPDMLPRDIWSKGNKVIFIYRNPKDAILSFYHHHRLFNEYKGTLDQFVKAFMGDRVQFTPFWNLVLTYWALNEKPNLLFITYEDMKKDLRASIRRVSKFLGEGALSPETEQKLLDHLSFEQMRVNPSVNYERSQPANGRFMRKGESGQWKKDLSYETVQAIDRWSLEKIGSSGFPYYS